MLRTTGGFPANFFINNAGDAAGLFNSFDPTGYTVNKSPDFLVKATVDPGWGHYEVVGILSPFRNRVYPCGAFPLPATFPTATCTSATSVAGASNDSRTGGGIGVTGRFPVIAKKLDLVAHFQGGDGMFFHPLVQVRQVDPLDNIGRFGFLQHRHDQRAPCQQERCYSRPILHGQPSTLFFNASFIATKHFRTSS